MRGRAAGRPARRARRDRRAAASDEAVLPLINIVFLLLVFFMVAGRLAPGDPFEVEAPRSAAAARPGGERTLLVGAEGQLALDGRRLTRPALIAEIAGRAAAEAAAPLRIRADRRADAAAVVALMAELRAAGATRIGLLTLPAGGAR
ncbi:hypothetical protein LNKW23_33870 [Paralimibaculum aggregatum]|uniref:Biopolymer transporter ExbD n=1 Tax=Paralimibaculum aggregatum TaxID=3036245 RepID=A0ABQ6LRG6_9RHOB|nr:biopolymer transporter ExbD [Limibaculum sp. NKW23]GMG84173.1 hypothetical protein LNKW23_33870 [Limibaculum sp. NKW23]